MNASLPVRMATFHGRGVFGPLVMVAIAVAMVAAQAVAGILYVKHDAAGADDGSSWGDAFTDVQPALHAARAGDEIWVAGGTYRPTHDHGLDIGERGKHFRLRNGVGVYGGFAGTETERDQRDWHANPTVLCGDLDGNDSGNIATGEPTRQDNCYHVFYHPEVLALDQSAILDGVTITGGNANGAVAERHHSGGGMHNSHAAPTVHNCVFIANSAQDGGAMGNMDASPVVTNGTFSGNAASRDGGAMSNWASSPTLNQCVFNGNTAVANGGAIGNAQSAPTVTNCRFEMNSATQAGGGMANSFSSPMVTNCIFTGNNAGYAGGAMGNGSSSPTVTHCTFAGNRATSYGGAIASQSQSLPTLINCIVWNNSAQQGGGIFNYLSTSTVTHSCVQAGHAGAGNIAVDPLFVDAAAGNVRLQADSPCIDAGTTVGAPATDFDGRVRVGAPDMGAYEFNSAPTAFDDTYETRANTVLCVLAPGVLANDNDPDGDEVTAVLMTGPANGTLALGADGAFTYIPNAGYTGEDGFTYKANDRAEDSNLATVTISVQGPVIHYVKHDAVGANTGLSWADAYTRLQSALDAARPDEEIWVAAGTYTPSSDHGLDIGRRGQHFRLENGIGVYGGFVGAETERDQRDWVANPTVLSGDLDGNDNDHIHPDEPTRQDNCYHVFLHPEGTNLDETAVLDGFIITGGNANGAEPFITAGGGGMFNHFSSPTVANCIFVGNSASGNGGGTYNESASPSFVNCVFRTNAAGRGAAMYNDSSAPTLIHCTLADNAAADAGGGMVNVSSSAAVINSIVAFNSSGLHQDGGTLTIVHTCVHNPEGDNFRGMADPTGTNGNISVDPLFVEATTGNLRLRAASPCVNAGDKAAVTFATDLDGRPRIIGAAVDMGAYEYPVTTHGDISVALAPPEAVAEGGRWRVDRGTWGVSGAASGPLLPGQHRLDFREIVGWQTPEPRHVGISVGETVEIMAQYERKVYHLNYVALVSGSIAGSTTQTVVHGQDAEEVEAVANDGYAFALWTDGSTDRCRTDVAVTGDLTVTAQFHQMGRDWHALELVRGWNQISLPFEPVEPVEFAVVFGAGRLHRKAFKGAVWRWGTVARGHARFMPATDIAALVGYQMFCPEPMFVMIERDLEVPNRLELAPGWNFRGVAAECGNPAATTEYAETFIGGVWWWNATQRRYRLVPSNAQLEPGAAYWFYASEEATIDLDQGP